MLRGTAVLLTGAIGGATLSSTAPKTSATTADTSLSVAGDEVVVRGDELAAVRLTLDTGWEYAVPSGERPETLTVSVLAGTSSDDLSVVDSASSSQVFLESSGEESFSVDLLGAGVLDQGGLVPEVGGESTSTTVVVGVEMQLVDESGLVIAADSQTDTATVVVEKSAYDPGEHGSVSGSGEVSVEVE